MVSSEEGFQRLSGDAGRSPELVKKVGELVFENGLTNVFEYDAFTK